ncbi:acid protease [Trametes versicolor FP-101664 SS1]|uniref:acid protease n=1 Tax=Trametes versicolor (strain FP-101664) TaxID=717944 RepID=UPI000462132B|nr:acid protease [Trametes versicolor FP-101664 SS1]EIW59132.1 acid protease [Trametes versicolor FP-101664 SS1]
MSNFVASRSVPFVTRVAGRHAKDIIARDRARAQKILQGINPHGPAAFHELRRRRHHGRHGHGHGGGDIGTGTGTGSSGTGSTGAAPPTSTPGGGVDVTDAGVTYTASVGVGSPPTQYTLLIDTGSSNTWVGAGQAYKKTSTSKSTGQSVNVSYGSGSFSGTEFTDTVTISSDLVIQNQSIGVASTAQGFSDVDGILGIGPVDLTQGTVGSNQPVPTVTDNLFAQGTIANDSIGIFYQPTTDSGALNGELTFGGVDTSKTTGDVSFVPITSTSPASQYWGIDQELTYGQDTTLLSGSAGIVDTGTTLLLIATDAFQAYQKATGAKLDNTTGLLTITEAQFENLQSLFFNIGGTSFELTPNAQIWPRALNSTIGGEEGKIYLVASDLGNQSGQGLDFINGFAFLQRFYSVYDTGNNQVGLATTPFTDAETN